MRTMPPLFAGMLLCTILLQTSVSLAQTRDDRFWVPNNYVKSVVVDDSRDLILLGGSFDYFGPFTGYHAVLNPSTGIYDPAFPEANETVDAAISDGSGGVYVGGGFTAVGAASRNFLAHIDASGNVTSWNPNPDGAILSLALHNGVLYVGGSFTTIAGESRSNIAAFDASTGNLLMTWVPDAITGEYYASIETIVPYGGKVYIAGSFNAVNATTRNKIAALSIEDGGLLSWNPDPTHWTDINDLTINAIVADGAHLFVGGRFTGIGGEVRLNIARIDTTDGSATAWDAEFDSYIYSGFMGPDTSGFVRTLLLENDVLYVGGHFVGFQDSISYGLAALDRATAAFLTGETPALPQYQSVVKLYLSGSTMYVGGDYSVIGGESRKNIASFDITTSDVSSWNPKASDDINAIALHDDGIYIGGYFYSVNGEIRNGLAAMTQSTAELTSWNPNASTADGEFSFMKMLIVDTTVYVAGRFTEINGNARTSLGAVGISGGGVLSFAPELSSYQMFSGPGDPEVEALAATATTLYVGGKFDTVDNVQRHGAAAFYMADGSLSNWNPEGVTNGSEAAIVYSLAVAGNRVYIGGDFESIKDSLRNNLAAVDTGSAFVFGCNPDVGGSVYALQTDGSTLYVGGGFTTMYGMTRNSLAEIDTSTGEPTSWDPNPNSSVDGIAVTPNNVYAVGFFDEIGGGFRNSAAALDKSTGLVTAWDPQLSSGDAAGVIAISTAYQLVYIGDGFNTMMGDYANGFGAVDNPYDAALPVELVSFTAQQNGKGVELSWSTATERNNYGFEIEKRRMKDELGSMNWEKIGFVEGHGTTNAPKSYTYIDGNAEGNFAYRLKQIDRDGSFSYSAVIETGSNGSPAVFALGQNYPNPFNPETSIKYSIPAAGHVSLKVYDLLGKEVASLVSEVKEPGNYSAAFNASSLSTGVYIYRLTAGSMTTVKKLMVIK